MKIKIPPQSAFSSRGAVVPGSVWKEPGFTFTPRDYVPSGCPRLTEKVMAAGKQTDSLNRFLEDPSRPAVYGVGSAPADNKARYFAAFLVQSYLERSVSHSVIWEPLHVAIGPSSALKARTPTFLVLENIFDNTSSARLEKLRDLLLDYDSIPRVVITSGIDPFSMITGKLGYRMDGIFFHAEKSFKQVEVV